LLEAGARFDAEFLSLDDTLSASGALIASGSDETMARVRERALKGRLEPERLLLRGHRFGVAVLDGQESGEERIGLAEDMLLHEGLGCRSVAIVFAPAGGSPDPLLEAMAMFRNTFPSHPESKRILSLQHDYLQAVETPHAYGDEFEFLLSKGDPEAQRPPHVRWSEYASLDEVRSWLDARQNVVQVVVASGRIREEVGAGHRGISPGNAQRPSLGWGPDGVRTAAFLRGL
jgi:hypothetical protein